MRFARIVTVAALGLTLSSSFAFANDRRIDRRQANQQHRIAEGIENGTLTPRETATLERQEARINQLEAKMRRDGDGLSPKERTELNRLLNTESHRIYAAKHDGPGK
jgi:hypothetical protein